MKLQTFILFLVVYSTFAEDKEEKYCETLDHCEDDRSYPEQILNQLDLWKYKFNGLDEYEMTREKRSVDLNSDANQFLVETKLCESMVSFKRPRMIKNVNNQWRTIVNHQNFTQIVRHEECSSVNFPCTWNIYPKTVRSFCQQNKIVKSLWAFDERRRCLVMDKFLLPVTCDCMIEKDDILRGVRKELLEQQP